MREEEVKEAVWKDFQKFMHGQTVGIYEDGETNYYAWDVLKYCRYDIK